MLRQAFDEKVKTCLVLNKIDRLVIEKEMTAEEIYVHLLQIVEQVNSIVAELISKEYLSSAQVREDLANNNPVDAGETDQDFGDDMLEQQENELFFCPEKGNVAFSSALDCWAFNLTGFAQKLA